MRVGSGRHPGQRGHTTRALLREPDALGAHLLPVWVASVPGSDARVLAGPIQYQGLRYFTTKVDRNDATIASNLGSGGEGGRWACAWRVNGVDGVQQGGKGPCFSACAAPDHDPTRQRGVLRTGAGASRPIRYPYQARRGGRRRRSGKKLLRQQCRSYGLLPPTCLSSLYAILTHAPRTFYVRR
jgi:hypothetical protein